MFLESTMESRYNAMPNLVNIAEKLESEILAKIKFTSAHVIDLDRLLCDTFFRQGPKPLDFYNRRALVQIFNMITKEIYGNRYDSPVVEEYGSFVMDMFDEKSDVDLSINFNNSIEVSRGKKISTLHKFNKKLQLIQSEGHVSGLQLILSARVPIIKVTDCGTGIECDLSVDNRDGIAKSRIIRAICGIDERFRKLCFLMKSWAKAHDINSPKDSTLSSFSIVLLVAFHLQTRNPPILPPFSALLKEGNDPASVAKVVRSFFNFGKRNKESLAMLFITLLAKLASVETLWQKGFCASLYEGSWILKSWKHSYSISVEDFIDRSDNVARAVGKNEVKRIYECIHKSLNHLTQFLNGESQGNNLIDVLFQKNSGTLKVGGVIRKVGETKNNHDTLRNPPLKKRHLRENFEEKQVQIPEKKIVQGLQGTGLPPRRGWMQHTIDETVCNPLASLTSPASYYQPSLATSSSNIKVNQNFRTTHLPLNPALEPQSVGWIQHSLDETVRNALASLTSSVSSINSHHPRVGHNPYREKSFYIRRP